MRARRVGCYVSALAVLWGCALPHGPSERTPPGPASNPPPAIVDSIGLRLVRIPAGEFRMGSPDGDETARPDEQPQRRVRIARAFYLGAREVTVGQFRQFVRETGHTTDSEKKGDPKTWHNAYANQSDAHPVVYVSWHDAVAFCEWLRRKEGKPYRLPTEAEWEYACRAGTTTRFAFGDEAAPLVDYAWFAANAGGNAHPVGLKGPNAFGLFDMHGNVWEWCADWYRGSNRATASADDRSSSGSGTHRVIRGGCHGDEPDDLRSAGRFKVVPTSRNGFLGFRVVREIEGSET
jgi:formylglycine-generating enzyme required for sulfatase activity